MIRRPPRSTRVRSSAASDVYKRQGIQHPHRSGGCGNRTESCITGCQSCTTKQCPQNTDYPYGAKHYLQLTHTILPLKIKNALFGLRRFCLLYTSDAADDLTRVDL